MMNCFGSELRAPHMCNKIIVNFSPARFVLNLIRNRIDQAPKSLFPALYVPRAIPVIRYINMCIGAYRSNKGSTNDRQPGRRFVLTRTTGLAREGMGVVQLSILLTRGSADEELWRETISIQHLVYYQVPTTCISRICFISLT